MSLETIWFFLWVLLWAIYLILDGFDFGLGTLMPFVAKDNPLFDLLSLFNK